MSDLISMMIRTDKRRVNNHKLPIWTFLRPDDIISGSTSMLLHWIDKNTTGKFKLDYSKVAFQSESDALLFKLWYRNQ